MIGRVAGHAFDDADPKLTEAEGLRDVVADHLVGSARRPRDGVDVPAVDSACIDDEQRFVDWRARREHAPALPQPWVADHRLYNCGLLKPKTFWSNWIFVQ